jgi:Na+-transporting NADH:ubiquinone oxidoreductase subunit C
MAFGNGYIFGFSAVICVVCSLAVAGMSQAMKPLQQLNQARDTNVNILQAVGLPEDGSRLQGEAIDKMFAERVRMIVVDDQGVEQAGKTMADLQAAQEAAKGSGKSPGLHAVYVRLDEGKPSAYALPIEGKGLWGPISGFLAVGPDGSTVVGATFFAPKETPGLGYEMHPIDVVKGSAAQLCPGKVEHCVDGVSGSTLTSRGVDAMVDRYAHVYEPYLRNLQKGGL